MCEKEELLRRLFVELSVDESRLLDEDDDTIGDRLEQEFGWLEQSGVFLEQYRISDEDDVDDWARYINYLFEWAFEHSYEEDTTMSPYSYAQWEAFGIVNLMLSTDRLDREEVNEHIHDVVVYQKTSGMSFRDIYKKTLDDVTWAMTELKLVRKAKE